MAQFIKLTDAVGIDCYFWFGPGTSIRRKTFPGGQSLSIIEMGAEGLGVRETPEKILALIAAQSKKAAS